MSFHLSLRLTFRNSAICPSELQSVAYIQDCISRWSSSHFTTQHGFFISCRQLNHVVVASTTTNFKNVPQSVATSGSFSVSFSSIHGPWQAQRNFQNSQAGFCLWFGWVFPNRESSAKPGLGSTKPIMIPRMGLYWPSRTPLVELYWSSITL